MADIHSTEALARNSYYVVSAAIMTDFRFYPYLSENVFDVKKEQDILCTFIYDFYVKKRTIHFVIGRSVSLCIKVFRVLEILQKWPFLLFGLTAKVILLHLTQKRQ